MEIIRKLFGVIILIAPYLIFAASIYDQGGWDKVISLLPGMVAAFFGFSLTAVVGTVFYFYND